MLHQPFHWRLHLGYDLHVENNSNQKPQIQSHTLDKTVETAIILTNMSTPVYCSTLTPSIYPLDPTE